MRYRKIRASWKDGREILNRVFLLEEHHSVLDFTVILQKMLHMQFTHLFEIEAEERRFQPRRFGEFADRFLEDTEWDEPGQNFTFSYDFGGSWDFDIFVFKRFTDLDDRRHVILLEGKGAGIWEDALSEFWFYHNHGKLPEGKEYVNFMPWNLEHLGSLEKTLEFDIEADQKEMDQFMKNEFADTLKDMTTDREAGMFDAYMHQVNLLYESDRAGNDAANVANTKEAAKQFFIACAALRKEMKLPMTLAEFETLYQGMVDPMPMISYVPMILSENGEYEFEYDVAKQLIDFFPTDPDVRRSHDSMKITYLAQAGRFEEAHAFLDELEQIENYDFNFDGNRLYILTCEGKYEEAENILSRHVDEDEEPLYEHYPMYLYAYELYSKFDPETAAKYNAKIEAIESTLIENGMDSEDEFTEANEELAFETKRFMEKPDQIRYSLATACFVILTQMDGFVIVPLENDDTPACVYDDNGGEYMAVYSQYESMPDSPGESTAVRVRAAVEYALESGMSGICVDPDDYGYGLLINRDTLEEICNVMDDVNGNERVPLLLS